jgi:hypothetical protein
MSSVTNGSVFVILPTLVIVCLLVVLIMPRISGAEPEPLKKPNSIFNDSERTRPLPITSKMDGELSDRT